MALEAGTFKVRIEDTCLSEDGRAIIIKGKIVSFYMREPRGDAPAGWYKYKEMNEPLTHYCYLTGKENNLLKTNIEQIEKAFGIEISNPDHWDKLLNNGFHETGIQVDIEASTNAKYPFQVSWMRHVTDTPVRQLKKADQSVATALFNRLKAAAPAKPLSAGSDPVGPGDELPF